MKSKEKKRLGKNQEQYKIEIIVQRWNIIYILLKLFPQWAGLDGLDNRLMLTFSFGPISSEALEES